MATTVNRLESQVSGKLPSQSVVNPKQNASAITLRSGKELRKPNEEASKYATKEEIKKEVATPQKQNTQLQQPPTFVTPPPFPSRFAKSKKEEVEQEIFETFCKVEVNIPLLDAIKQIPRYAKFLKELCTTKKKLKGNEKICISENVSAVL